MAMAAVRFAVRRLSGQQPQAILRSAVANEQGVLNRGGSPGYALRRITSSEVSAPKINSESHPSVSGDSRLVSAHQKKEELIDLLIGIQRNKDISYARRVKDRLLLQRLTSHVKHRPIKPEWHRYLQEYKVTRFLLWTTILFTNLYSVGKWSDFFNRHKQLQGVDSNNKASVYYAEANIEE